MSILRELFRKFPFFFARFWVGQESAAAGGRDIREPCVRRIPFVQDTLYGLRDLHNGHCV